MAAFQNQRIDRLFLRLTSSAIVSSLLDTASMSSVSGPGPSPQRLGNAPYTSYLTAFVSIIAGSQTMAFFGSHVDDPFETCPQAPIGSWTG